MSRLWPERAAVVLDHGGVELHRRGTSERIVAARLDDDRAGWQAALGALEEGVERGGLGGATLAVTLRCDLLRLQLLPWHEEIESRAEFDAYARISFEEVYGTLAREWSVVTASAPPGAPRLAAAVESAFLDGLRALARRHRLRLSQVRPSLSALCHARRRLLPPSYLLLLAEAGRACIAFVRDRRWQSVRCDADDDSDPALQRALERACLLLELSPAQLPPLFVCAPQREALALAPVCGAMPQRLAGI